MSDKQPQNAGSDNIRNKPLHDYEKKELTHYLRDLSLAPSNQGKLVIHFNGGMVCRVEPQPILG